MGTSLVDGKARGIFWILLFLQYLVVFEARERVEHCLPVVESAYWNQPVCRVSQGRSGTKERLSFTFTANGKRQTVDSCVSQKRENLRFSTCVTLEKLFDISS